MKGKFIIIALLLQGLGMKALAQQTWTLQQCIDYAVEHNLTVKQYEGNVEQRKINLSTSKNSRLPSLSASANQSFSFGRGLTSNNTYANRNTQSTSFDLSTNMPLITGGQIPNEIKQRKLDLQAAIADLDKAKESVALRVISAYLEVIYQKDLVTVAERQVELSTAQVNRMQRLYENNKVSGAEVAQIKATKANDETALTQQRNSYMLAMLDLSQLLELPSPENMELQKPEVAGANNVVLPAPDAVYSEALGIKPQIQAEELRLKSAERGVNIAKAGNYPTLYFSAGMGSSYYKTSGFQAQSFSQQMKDNFNRYLGFSLSFPIFNRFATRNAIRSAKVQVMTQQLQVEETRKTLYKEIQQAYYNALAAQRQCVSTDVACESANEAFTLMKTKYENGKANATDFQDSKTTLMKAESSAIQAKYTFLFRQKILDFYRNSLSAGQN